MEDLKTTLLETEEILFMDDNNEKIALLSWKEKYFEINAPYDLCFKNKDTGKITNVFKKIPRTEDNSIIFKCKS